MSLKKIYLKSKTGLSLNDRFTFLRQQNERVTEISGVTSRGIGVVGGVDQMRQARGRQQRATAKNHRLALQMENRPAVAAALRIKKRSLRQRIGQIGFQEQVSVKDRLTLAPRGRLGWRGRARGRGVMQRGVGGMRSRSTMMTNLGNNFNNRLNVTGRGGYRSRARQPRGRGVVARGGQNYVARGGAGTVFVQNRRRGWNSSPRGFRGGNIRRQQTNVSPNQRGGRGQQQQQQIRGRGRIQTNRARAQGRGGRGRGRSPRQQRAPPPTREQLDDQLDEYMAGTKAQLDKELDSYMSTQDDEGAF